MLIEVKGKERTLKDLEKAQKLIKEAGSILYRTPTILGLEACDTETKTISEGGEKMLESPRNRINGTDEFMVQRSAARILEEMQKSGWTQGETELLPKYLESAIKQNSERIRKLKPFAICEITKESL